MVSTQIINAVRNYTDDALRAAQKAKNTRYTSCAGSHFFENANGQMSIIKGRGKDHIATYIDLNNGDSFSRVCDGNSLQQTLHFGAIPDLNISCNGATMDELNGMEVHLKNFLKNLFG